MDKTTVGYYMWQHVNTWPDKPVKQITFNSLPKKGLAIMLMQLSGLVVDRQYVNGTIIGRWPFAMYVRIPADDVSGRLNAIQILQNFADWLEQHELPFIGENRTPIKVVMSSLPAIDTRWPDGSEDYQAIFALQYKETKGE